MKYACLIYNDETNAETNPQFGTPGFEPMMAGYMAFGEKHGASITGGEALHDTHTATSVRLRDGEIHRTDGPFAETKEHLGGFYIIEAENLDEAISVAADIPHAASGTVEVRPCMVFED